MLNWTRAPYCLKQNGWLVELPQGTYKMGARPVAIGIYGYLTMPEFNY